MSPTPKATARDAEQAVLRIDNVVKSFGETEVLRGISLNVEHHEVVALIGGSGSGKSTLLRCINLLEQVDDGQIFLDNRELTDPRVKQDEVRTHIGIVFQQFNLFPHMSVADNVALASRHVFKKNKVEAREEAHRLLERIGLGEKADEFPDRLSGGQQQRAAIARAIATNPRILLLDEVTSALDPELVGEVLDLIRELKQAGVTIVMATHEMDFARDVADRVAFLDNGVILEEGPAKQVLSKPREARTREYLTRFHASR
jgi:polar amino acid transport system ATP-binding protein